MNQSGSSYEATSPQGYGPPGGSLQQPKPAKIASTLGIVSGALGIASALLTFFFATALQNELNKLQGRAKPDLFAQATTLLNLSYALVATTIAVGILLLVSSIQFRRGKGYALLRAGAIAQIVIVVAELPVTLGFSGLFNTAPNAGSFLRVVVGLGLAITILIHLLKPETKQWKDSVS